MLTEFTEHINKSRLFMQSTNLVILFVPDQIISWLISLVIFLWFNPPISDSSDNLHNPLVFPLGRNVPRLWLRRIAQGMYHLLTGEEVHVRLVVRKSINICVSQLTNKCSINDHTRQSTPGQYLNSTTPHLIRIISCTRKLGIL